MQGSGNKRWMPGLHCSSLEEHHLKDLPASVGCGREHVSCEPELEVSITAQGTENEGAGQFRMGIRSSLNFANFKGLNIRKFL